MMGRIAGLGILLCAVIAGGGLYYLQVYGYYRAVPAEQVVIRLTPLDGGAPQVLAVTEVQAIDAHSSPIRFRACFTLAQAATDLAGRFETRAEALPRLAPKWFDCFDAPALTQALQSGAATAYLGEKNIAFGVDRIVAIDAQGRGFVWHDLNDCGDKAYDGTIVGEECPRLPETK